MSVTHLHLTASPPTVKKGEVAYAGNLLSVEEARNLVALTHRRPWQGDKFVIHITQAHRVRDDVWNTLLKPLEEPPDYVEWHLYAASTDSLPRTIKSRSHVSRESIPDYTPEDASRLIRLYESGDALAIVREADRHSSGEEAFRTLEGLHVWAAQTGRLDASVQAEYYATQIQRGASPRVVMKALLMTLAIRHRQAQARKEASA